MQSRVEDIPVRVIRDTSQGVVPGKESGEQGEEAACLEDGRIGHVHGVTVEIANAE